MGKNLISLPDEASQAFTSIPIVDLAGVIHFESAQSDDKIKVAREISAACANVGFFYIKNHEVPQSAIDAAFSAGREFFDLPEQEKMKIDLNKSAAFRGYNAVLAENVDPTNRGDLHEGFNMGPDSQETDISMTGINVWPDLPGFKENVMPYYESVVSLGLVLFKLFALALELPENFFDDKTKNSAAIMRLLHYPPQDGYVDDRVIGIGAHSDYECFTILRQDEVPALQVLNSKQQWIDAPPIPDTFVVNIGDQFARWTNDVFKSTTHRVINRSGVRRYSSPLFFGTDYDVLIEALPTCVSPEHPAKYSPVKAGDYVKFKLAASYGHKTTDVS